jgi:2-hydroxy-6-oxonona-2,4-dienedioate hydrolase
MGTLKIGWLPAGILAIAVDVVAVLVYARYRRDMGAAQGRLRGAGSQVIETGCRPMEYATHGEGSPVLVVHGILGGSAQGLVIAGGNLGNGFHSIVPSRFGYLRTPLPDGASPPSAASQADAFACLLDALDIERAAVLGTSAGGAPPSSSPCGIPTAVRRWCSSPRPRREKQRQACHQNHWPC